MTQTVIFTNVPSGQRLNELLSDLRLEGAEQSHTQEADGRFTVTAVYPEPEPPPTMPPDRTIPGGWMKVATGEEGVAEFGGGRSNPRIEAYHATTRGGAASDSIPWCSSFVNYCITKSGLEGTNSKAARSWLNWGVSSDLQPGAIVVLERGSPPHGHVGFFAGMDGNLVRLLGGNQGNKVDTVGYQRERLIGVRWPAAVTAERPPIASGALSGVTEQALPEPRHSFDLASLREEYRRYFTACTVNAAILDTANRACVRIEAEQGRYAAMSAQTDVPWYVIALLHHMECNCDFAKHLHNGDPLTGKTVNKPSRRPESGPANGVSYTWEESALDALADLRAGGAWSIERLLFHAERFNGWGYRMRGLPSAYLWSGSNIYKKGKFVRDGEFDPEAVSAQLGVGVVLRRLIDRGIVEG